MIKMLIKKMICKHWGFNSRCEEAYRWIIESPIRQWPARMWCIRHGDPFSYEKLYEWMYKSERL